MPETGSFLRYEATTTHRSQNPKSNPRKLAWRTELLEVLEDAIFSWIIRHSFSNTHQQATAPPDNMLHESQQYGEKESRASRARMEHLAEYTKRMLVDYPNLIVRDCKSSKYPRRKYNHKTWKLLQRVYREEAHKLHRRNFGVAWSARHTGMQIPFHVKDDGPRGRSVYSAIDIEKGTKIWNPSKLATFDHPLELVNFLQRLSHDLQCDVLLWAYPDAENENVGLALDEGTFVNHAESDELKNMGSTGYALRDIRAGEEILEDYTEFIGVQSLEWFNIIRARAWEEEIDSSPASSATDIHTGYVHAGALPDYDYSQFSPLGEDKFAFGDTVSTQSILLAFSCISFIVFSWKRGSIQYSQRKDVKAQQ